MTQYSDIISKSYRPAFNFTSQESNQSDSLLYQLPEELLVDIMGRADTPATTLVCRKIYRMTIESLKKKLSTLLSHYNLFSRKIDELAQGQQATLFNSRVLRNELKMQRLEELIDGSTSLSLKELQMLSAPDHFKEALIENLAIRIRLFTSPTLLCKLKSDKEFQESDVKIIESAEAFVAGEVWIGKQLPIYYQESSLECTVNTNGRHISLGPNIPYISVITANCLQKTFEWKDSALPLQLFVDPKHKNTTDCLQSNFKVPCINSETVCSFTAKFMQCTTRYKLICRDTYGPYLGKTITEAVHSEILRTSEETQKSLLKDYQTSSL